MEVKSNEYELLLTLKDCSNWFYMRLYLLELTQVWFIKRSFVDWGHLTYVRLSSLRPIIFHGSKDVKKKNQDDSIKSN